MDGLELSRRLNREYPNIYIMLCTGFDEFEYAKEAVHLEIKEYMLKPCLLYTSDTAFIHVGRKRDQAETDGSVELSRIYIYGKYTADSGTGCGR